MTSGTRRWPAVVGWLTLVVIAAAWAAIAWSGFGLSLVIRVAAGAVVVILILLQVALWRWNRGGVVQGSSALVLSLLVVFAGYRWLPSEHWAVDQRTVDTAEPPPGTFPPTDLPFSWTVTTRPTGPKSGKTSTGSGSGDNVAEYSNLPNAGRYACATRIFPKRPIDAIKAGFDASNWRPRLLKLLDTRYPDAAVVVGRLKQPSLFDAWFRGGRGDWAQAMTELSTGVHESLHMVDLAERRGNEAVFVLTADTQLRFPIPKTFHRSAIADMLPEAIKSLSYTQTYLSGASGAQGFEMVLEEHNAYTYSVLTAVAVADQMPSNMRTSIRDGLMVFIYYVEAYLRLARTEKTDTYKAIAGNAALRDATVQLNDRAECALSLTAGHDQLGIADAAIWPHVFGKQALGEIARLRTTSAGD